MKALRLFGWGIVIYSIMLFTWDLLGVYGLGSGEFARILSLVVLVIITTIAARSLGFDRWTDILPFSISWAIIMCVLDGILAMPSIGTAVYTTPDLWVNYALVVLLPLLAPLSRKPAHERG